MPFIIFADEGKTFDAFGKVRNAADCIGVGRALLKNSLWAKEAKAVLK